MQINKITCPECKNEIEVIEGAKSGDVLECEFCGVELEITEIKTNGEIEFMMLEEEK